jgi:dipeptidyl aminopeptidase/acylaminoacyl peptidase
MKPFTCSRPTAISRCLAALGVAAVAFALPGFAKSQALKITAPTPSSIRDLQISTPADPQDARAVFLATTADFSSGPKELWSVSIQSRINGTKLSDLLIDGREVTSFRLSKDGRYAVFLANKDDAAKQELYSVPIDGSAAPVKRSGTLVMGGNVIDYAISDNSQRIVYRADKDVDGRVELYSVPISSGSGMKIVDVAAATGDVDLFLISPDSSRVVFRADLDTNDKQELYSVGIASTTVTKSRKT